MKIGWRGEETQCGTERWWWKGHGWSHIHMWWIKIGRDALGVNDPSPRSSQTARPRDPALGREIPITSGLKTSGGCGSRINYWIFRKLCLKGLHSLKRYVNPPTLQFNSRTTAGRMAVTYREWMKWLKMVQQWGKAPEARQWHCLLSQPSPCTEPQSGEVGCPTPSVII